jgi:hypothetical protein
MPFVMEEIMKDELKRIREVISSYLREIKKLPKGSVQRKKIRGHVYPYLAVREGSQVSYRYLGKLPSVKLEELNKEIERRRQYRRLLAEAKKNKKRLEGMLYGKRRAV